MINIIKKKKLGQELSYNELKYVIEGYINKTIPDYQVSALLMAINIKGMSDEEVFALTDIMINSGDKIDLNPIKGIKVDKHSTGGVGDKTTLILAPLVASTGVIVPKMSGRGLGHTGGTIDKLESIEGFKVNRTNEEFVKQVNEIGVAITEATGDLVPADKLIYSLRDVTGTVESIPLIASSIMSKKIASGADKIVIDIKVGNGALISSLEDAKKLASLMVRIGKKYQKETVCVLTNMNEPLGYAIGNKLEVVEAVNILNGNPYPEDLYRLVVELGSIMVSLGKNIDQKEAKKEVIENLNNGKAYNKFLEMVAYQQGEIDKFYLAEEPILIKSSQDGFINDINTSKLGEIVRHMGAGRLKKGEAIDYEVGFVLNKKVGDIIMNGDELLKIYLGNQDTNINEIISCFKISDEIKKKEPLIYEIIK